MLLAEQTIQTPFKHTKNLYQPFECAFVCAAFFPDGSWPLYIAYDWINGDYINESKNLLWISEHTLTWKQFMRDEFNKA